LTGHPKEPSVSERLEQRLGWVHARQRLGIETDHEQRVFGGGLNFFHIENWYSAHSVIKTVLRLTGLYRRARRNAQDIRLRENVLRFRDLPPAFDGFTILHISDLHADMNGPAMARLAALLPDLRYDACVLTGDFRGKTFGSFAASMRGMRDMRQRLHDPVYGVLGNHDSIRMVPELEQMGIRMLLNEQVAIRRGEQSIHIAGIDDAHYYRVDNIEKSAAGIPFDAFAVLLSHTPEIFRQAAHAGFRLMLSGHTHGGQLCLPGSIPLTLDAALPRRFGAGAWEYGGMAGYTSVGVGTSIIAVRLNCPPEITLHRLHCG
jgi:predicted MPP superfamily phosphohydrolase